MRCDEELSRDRGVRVYGVWLGGGRWWRSGKARRGRGRTVGRWRG